jgi:hypothetical protein
MIDTAEREILQKDILGNYKKLIENSVYKYNIPVETKQKETKTELAGFGRSTQICQIEKVCNFDNSTKQTI